MILNISFIMKESPVVANLSSTERPGKKQNQQQEGWTERTEHAGTSCDITHAGGVITWFCGRPGQHNASQGAERPDRHAGGPVTAGPGSSCHHLVSLLPAPSQPELSPDPQPWPGNYWAPSAAAHESVRTNISMFSLYYTICIFCKAIKIQLRIVGYCVQG